MHKKGVAHTVAVPEPGDYVAPEFLTFLRLHRAQLDDEYRDFLEEQSIAEFAAVADQFTDGSLRDALPEDLNIGSGCASSDQSVQDALNDAIAQVPIQWRLDAVLVLGDLLDEWDDQ